MTAQNRSCSEDAVTSTAKPTTRKAPQPITTLRRNLLIAAGTLCVGLGILGVILPILPTTPFLLLAAACYARSSKRFYDWLMYNRFLGEYIRNYREGRGMTVLHKVIVLVMLWGVISYSALIAIDILWVRILLTLIASGVTIHILTIPTCARRR